VNRIELWFSREPDLDLLADAQRFDALPLGYSTAPDEHRQRRKLSGNVRRDRLRPHDARTRAHARARERPQIETALKPYRMGRVR
jgi:hypothetical protein